MNVNSGGEGAKEQGGRLIAAEENFRNKLFSLVNLSDNNRIRATLNERYDG